MSDLYLPDIQDNALQFSANFSQDGFIYELLAVYGISKASIKRMRQSQEPFMMNNKVHFMATDGELEEAIKELKGSSLTKKKKSRFLVATDFKRMRALDTKTEELLDVALEDFFEDYGFFLPWTGREKVQVYEEIEADQKAAQKMAKLFEIIRLGNPSKEPEDIDALNHFFSRLIFCYYAEDTGIFETKGAFTNYIEHHTDYDGSNTADALRDIFKTLNTQSRSSTLNILKVFPYVNGGLFEQDFKVPILSSRARRMLIECGKINWSKINPDIFGSMFQGVMDDDIRHELGAHYTSVPNIMKVINPLFMDDLREELNQVCEYKQKSKKIEGLKRLHERISSLKIFDPACGSGNFLITAYKELRYLEMQIIKTVHEVTGAGNELGAFSTIEVSQFYGIELSPFAVELAKLSMWLAEHQVNMEFQRKFTTPIPSIPLRKSANVVAGNACRIDWENVCPKDDDDEVYVLGNPPYLGARLQTKEQKSDIEDYFSNLKGKNGLDYISIWFHKAAIYISENIRCAFVSTNSICQGQHVSLLWPSIFECEVEIGFAYETFKWKNSAGKQAGVSCNIVGLRAPSANSKKIYSASQYIIVENINAYLIDYKNIYIEKRTTTITRGLPKLVFGNQAIENGNLILSNDEANSIKRESPRASKFIRPLTGADDFIKNKKRYCIWIREKELPEAILIPLFKERIDNVRKYRKQGGEVARSLVDIPYRFRYIHEANDSILILPRTSSEKREYIPIGFLNAEYIVTDAAQVIYDPEPYIFGLITSRIHMAWMRLTCGRLESRYRYSVELCYNTFPVPSLSLPQKVYLEELSHTILDARDLHPGKTLAELYDPDKMPKNLRDAHRELDMAVDRIYRKEPFKNDEERLAYLFNLYEKMTARGE